MQIRSREGHLKRRRKSRTQIWLNLRLRLLPLRPAKLKRYVFHPLCNFACHSLYVTPNNLPQTIIIVGTAQYYKIQWDCVSPADPPSYNQPELRLLISKFVQGSPPPEERTFVDDDGTQFVWDPALRKFRPEDMPTPQAESGTQPQQPPKGDTAPGGEYTQVLIHHAACVYWMHTSSYSPPRNWIL